MSVAVVRAQLAMAVLVAWAPLAFTAPVPKPSPEQVRKELDTLWRDLESQDELTAGRALLKFAGWGDQAVDYLKVKVHPLKLSKKRAEELLTALSGKNEEASRAAFEELRYFDPRLALGDEELRPVLLDNRLLGAILCDLPADTFLVNKWHWHSPDNKVYRFNNFSTVYNRDIAIEVADIGTHGQKSSWVRAVRAVVVLEHIGTPAAAEVLEKMASGHPDAAPTKAAKAARDRMTKK